MEVLKSPNAPAAIGPYSQATVMGNLVFVSGQLPIDPKTGLMAENAAEATAQSIENISAILKEKNLTLADIGKTTIYLRDINDFAAVNEVYSKYFKEPYPARACFAVKTLPKDAIVEIEAIAEIK